MSVLLFYSALSKLLLVQAKCKMNQNLSIKAKNQQVFPTDFSFVYYKPNTPFTKM